MSGVFCTNNAQARYVGKEGGSLCIKLFVQKNPDFFLSVLNYPPSVGPPQSFFVLFKVFFYL